MGAWWGGGVEEGASGFVRELLPTGSVCVVVWSVCMCMCMCVPCTICNVQYVVGWGWDWVTRDCQEVSVTCVWFVQLNLRAFFVFVC